MNVLKNLRADALALCAPLIALVALHADAWKAWWTFDDPCLLAASLRHSPASHFFDPEVWRELSGSVLMPWTTLSLRIDHFFFGFDPSGYYAHQMIAFAVLLGAAYALLSRFLSPLVCALVLTLFTLSPPAFAATRLLMNRHYLEGLIFTVLAILCLQRRDLKSSVVGAVFYLLAMSAKEVFAPLIVVLPFLLALSWRERLRLISPFGVSAVFYAIWRLYMLGPGALSGYAPRGEVSKIDAVLAAPGLIGLSPILFAALTSLLLLGAAFRGRRTLLATTTTAIVLALPLVPILGELWTRHFFVPAFAACVLLGFLLDSLGKPMKIAAAILLPLFVGTMLTSAPVWKNYAEIVQKYEVEGRFVFSSDAAGDLKTDLLDAAFLRCVRELRVEADGRESGPGFCGDSCWCESVWRRDGGEIVAAANPKPTCDRGRAMSVELDWRDGRLQWRLEPAGRWEILLFSEDGVSVPLPLADSGSAPWPLGRPLRAAFRRHIEGGATSDSEVLEVRRDQPSVRWSRSATSADLSEY